MFFATHGVDSDDLPLIHEDFVSHLLMVNVPSRKAPACSEVAHEVRPPVKMVVAVTEAIVIQHEYNLVSLDELRTDCSVIGATSSQRLEYTVLSQKPTTRCSTL